MDYYSWHASQHLPRPHLFVGWPGSGLSRLAYAIASRTGLSVVRLQDHVEHEVGQRWIQLEAQGALGLLDAAEARALRKQARANLAPLVVGTHRTLHVLRRTPDLLSLVDTTWVQSTPHQAAARLWAKHRAHPQQPLPFQGQVASEAELATRIAALPSPREGELTRFDPRATKQPAQAWIDNFPHWNTTGA